MHFGKHIFQLVLFIAFFIILLFFMEWADGAASRRRRLADLPRGCVTERHISVPVTTRSAPFSLLLFCFFSPELNPELILPESNQKKRFCPDQRIFLKK